MTFPTLVLRFAALLLASLILILGIHLTLLYQQELPLYGDMILLSYVLNFVLAVAIFTALYLLRIRFKDQIGFLFMGGSMLKFVCFFIIFYPGYRADGDISNLEFAAFFVPYLLCLLLETIFTAKMLNTLK